jgi:uncharacterized repeat protein (TIGR03803 family)
MKTQNRLLRIGAAARVTNALATATNNALFAFGMLWALALAISAAGARADAVLTTLHTFGASKDGINPGSGLIKGNDGYFYGVTGLGGVSGAGMFYRVTADGAVTSLYSFTGGIDGGVPEVLSQSNDGNFYGSANVGGAYGHGGIFKLTTNGVCTILYSFPTNPTPNILVQYSDGAFYGTTQGGGSNNHGAVFKITTNGAFTILYSFTGGLDGMIPRGFVLGNDGNFYGRTGYGGTNNKGTLFKINAQGDFTSWYSFTVASPYGDPPDLVQGNDGNFYGLSGAGGAFHNGTFFQITPGGVLTTVYSFTNFSFRWGLLQGSDGNFYGTGSGPEEGETVFKVTINGLNANGAFTSLYSFTGGNEGNGPGGLVQGSDGNFYGLAGGGDAHSDGPCSESAPTARSPICTFLPRRVTA